MQKGRVLKMQNSPASDRSDLDRKRSGLSSILPPARFIDTAENECERARRYDRPLCVMITHADGLAAIASEVGAQRCEIAMAEVALCLANGLRRIDTRGRLGPSQIGILLPETRISQAQMVAERLQTAVAGLTVESKGVAHALSLNIGCAALSPRMKDAKSFLMLGCAELRKAKASGGGGVLSIAAPEELRVNMPRNSQIH